MVVSASGSVFNVRWEPSLSCAWLRDSLGQERKSYWAGAIIEVSEGEGEPSLLPPAPTTGTITELRAGPPESLRSELLSRRCFRREMYSASAPNALGSIVVITDGV